MSSATAGGVAVGRGKGSWAVRSKSAVLTVTADPRGASMDADLDLLLIAVYCTADDFLPVRPGNARRRISDAEVITLCVAQAMMGVPCDERFLRAARRQLGHLFPHLPERTAFHKRRLRLSGAIEALIREFARHSPGFYDDLLLVDSGEYGHEVFNAGWEQRESTGILAAVDQLLQLSRAADAADEVDALAGARVGDAEERFEHVPLQERDIERFHCIGRRREARAKMQRVPLATKVEAELD